MSRTWWWYHTTPTIFSLRLRILLIQCITFTMRWHAFSSLFFTEFPFFQISYFGRIWIGSPYYLSYYFYISFSRSYFIKQEFLLPIWDFSAPRATVCLITKVQDPSRTVRTLELRGSKDSRISGINLSHFVAVYAESKRDAPFDVCV